MLRKLSQTVGFSAVLYVYETIEAAIKIVVNSRHPSARHVTRTHRVDLDWLFERINHDCTISIKYNSTKDQIADILTKERFAVQRWTTPMHVFHIHTETRCAISHSSKKAEMSICLAAAFLAAEGTYHRDRQWFNGSNCLILEQSSHREQGSVSWKRQVTSSLQAPLPEETNEEL